MSVELTVETVNKAMEDGQGYNYHLNPHPIVGLGLSVELARIKRGVASIYNPRRAADFAKSNFENILEKIEFTGNFSLNPLDIVSIWAGTEDGTDEQRTALARSLIVNYSLRVDKMDDMSPTGSTWPEISQSYIETGKLPDNVAKRPQTLLHLMKRSNDIWISLREITVYIYGTDIPDQMRTVLQAAAISGEPQAIEAYDRFNKRVQERLNPTLARILQEFKPEVNKFQSYLEETISYVNHQPHLPNFLNQLA